MTMVMSRDLFKFWEIVNDILEMVQDGDIVTMEEQLKITNGMSNSTIANDLE